MARKDKNVTPSVTQKLQDLWYQVADWDGSLSAAKTPKEVAHVLATASKRDTGKPGYPDRVYVNAHEKLLILVEEKPTVKEHNLPDKEKGAINGIKWYLDRFARVNLPKALKDFFDEWKILGIAVSGDLSVAYQHKFNCYTFDTDSQKILPLPQVVNFITEEQFLALFNSLDEEKAVSATSISSKKINNLLRTIDSQKRPILLSALMICLHQSKRKTGKFDNDFPNFYKRTNSAGTIITNIFSTVQNVLKHEGIPAEKLAALDSELAFLKTDQTLNNSSILKDILIELETSVIPLFNSRFSNKSNYDIVGRFYEEFLKYAGISNVKKGIILTPRHITTLFTKLVDIKDNDRIVDLCCGTGAFLIAGMNALVEQIGKSSRTDKNEAIAKVKEKQLLGFEVNSTMYICALSNMLFRGDGKSSIYNYDSIRDDRANDILTKFQATIGFINPPYSGKDNQDDPTPKEITFLTKLLEHCERYGIIIAPLSAYFKDNSIREAILQKHTLKYVINMPGDLFQPNAAAHTAIAVFETNRAFDYKRDEVTFYDLQDDGFVLSKHKGRTDVYGRWNKTEQILLDSLKPHAVPDDITLVRTKIKKGDEWIIYAHSKTDYSTLSAYDFVRTISSYLVFEARRDLGILDADLTETELMGALSSYYDDFFAHTQIKVDKTPIDTSLWKEFTLCGKGGLFEYQHGERLTVPDRIPGDIPMITAGQHNQGYAQSISNYEESECFAPGMTIDMFSNAFYQNYSFAADDNIYVFNKPQKLNPHVFLFIATIIKQQQYKFGYGRQYRKKHAEKNVIKLPVTHSGAPDWKFMEQYIKSLPYADLF